MTMPIAERLLSKCEIDLDSGCWRWMGGLDGVGYGRIGYQGQRWSTHRLAYTLWIGEIPDGLVLDHVLTRGCVHRDCFNPDHLEAVTHRENLARSVLSPAGIARQRDTCKHGHSLEHMRINSQGHRVCRKCNTETAVRLYWDNPEKYRTRALEYHHQRKNAHE